MNQLPWNEWKSTTVGIVLMVLPVLAFFFPALTPDNQSVVVNGTGVLFDSAAQIASAIGGIILVFKTVWHKK